MRDLRVKIRVLHNPVDVTIPVNPPGGVGTPVVTQPPPKRGPVY
jgi:hypothetical protein